MLPVTPRDMGLYLPVVTFADFGDADFLADFLQWGGGGLGRLHERASRSPPHR